MEDEVLRSRFAVVLGAGAGVVGATVPEDASLRLGGISGIALISHGLYQAVYGPGDEKSRCMHIRRNNSAKDAEGGEFENYRGAGLFLNPQAQTRLAESSSRAG